MYEHEYVQDTSSSLCKPAGSLHFDIGEVSEWFIRQGDDSMTLSRVTHQNIMEVVRNCNDTMPSVKQEF